jgi:hypothetical protein
MTIRGEDEGSFDRLEEYLQTLQAKEKKRDRKTSGGKAD